MIINVNGNDKIFNEGITVTELISELKLDTEKVVIELNGDIPEKSRYSEIILSDSDKIEVIQFVGGG